MKFLKPKFWKKKQVSVFAILLFPISFIVLCFIYFGILQVGLFPVSYLGGDLCGVIAGLVKCKSFRVTSNKSGIYIIEGFKFNEYVRTHFDRLKYIEKWFIDLSRNHKIYIYNLVSEHGVHSEKLRCIERLIGKHVTS